MRSKVLISVSVFALSACNFGPSQLKPTEIERITDVNGGDDIIDRTLIEYNNDDLISELENRNQDDRFSFEYSYKSGVVSEIDYRGPGDDRVSTEFDISNGMIEGGTRNGDDFDMNFEITYFKEDIRFLKSIVADLDFDGSEQETVSTYSYDGTRIAKVTTDTVQSFGGEVVGSSRTITEFKYDDAGFLERLEGETQVGEQDPSFSTHRFQYDEEGRIDEVELEDADITYDLRYNEDGSVETVEGASNVEMQKPGTSPGFFAFIKTCLFFSFGQGVHAGC